MGLLSPYDAISAVRPLVAACPCGCGRNVGFVKKRLASHAVDLRCYLPIGQRLAQVGSSLPAQLQAGFRLETGSSVADGAKAFASGIQAMVDQFLRAAHGDPNAEASLPSVAAEMNRFRDMGNVMAVLLLENDGPWFATYRGGLHATGRRLLDSMVFQGKANLGRHGR